jgi:catechol 2,3-dioxygenase-like lactoylglutathione lyase family enzyme
MADAYMKLRAISHFGIDCVDMGNVLGFYRDLLNMRVIHEESGQNKVWLTCENGQLLSLTKVDQHTPMITRRPNRPEGPHHDDHVALDVIPGQYQEAVDRLKAAGVVGKYYGERPAPPVITPTACWYYFDPEHYGVHYECVDYPGAPADQVRMQGIDHFTYEVDDITAAEKFFEEVLELPLWRRLGVPEFMPQVLRHTFHTMTDPEGHEHHIGFFHWPELKGTRPLKPQADYPRCWGFEVAEADFEPALRKLELAEVEYLGPTEFPKEWPIARSVRFNDPSGYPLEVCVRNQPVNRFGTRVPE